MININGYEVKDTVTLTSQVNDTMAKDMCNSQDEAIKKALVVNGLAIDPAFIKDHLTIIHCMGDQYEHIWYHFGQPDAKRIISIEKDIRLSWVEDGGNYTMKAERNYY